MEVRAFRGLMIAALAVTVVQEVIAAAADPWTLSIDPKLRDMYLFANGFVVLMVAVALTGFLGMFTLKAWGRTLSLVATLLGLVLWAGGLYFAQRAGTTIPANPFTVLDQIAALCWGGALSLAYFSPLKARFGANNSFKPTPLRGAA